MILQDGDPSVVEESLDQLTEFIIDLCMHLGPTRFLDNVGDLVVDDILHDCPDDENLDGVLEARILNFKDNTTIKAICKYFITKQPTPDTTH